MCSKTSVESIISMQTGLLFLTMMQKPEKSLSAVNPETNEEVIIQFRVVERDGDVEHYCCTRAS